VAALTGPGLEDVLSMSQVDTAEEARAAVDEGEAEAAIIIPEGLTEGLRGELSTSEPRRVEVYKDPSATVGPAIVAAITGSIAQSLDGARAAALTAVDLALAEGSTDPQQLEDLAIATAQAYGAAAAGDEGVALDPRGPVIPGAEDRPDPNVASQVLVGMMIFFMFFGGATAARSILDEHRQGTLFRLFTTPTRRTVVLSGKYVGVFVVVLLQSVILLLIGWLLFGAEWGELGPVIALTLAGALVAASLGLLTVSFAKTPAQAGAVSSAIFVFLGLVGGNFVGTANLEGTFAAIRRFTPNGWLIEGWGEVLYGGSWASVALPLMAAIGFSVVFFALATWFFSRRYA
jgi:ABC-2 type transport system permease protein